MTKKLIAGVLLAGALFTAGCSTGDKANVEGGAFDKGTMVTVHLKDGRSVPCLTYDRGISCDWANAK